MRVPQRLTFVTLGAHELQALRQLYRAIGWTENEGSDDSLASFDCGSVKLALYPIDLLRDEAAPGAELPHQEVWNGVTLAVNLSSRAEVRGVYAAAIACGATAVAEPTERDWGGFSGYIADPEGNRWEVAWAPGFDSF